MQKNDATREWMAIALSLKNGSVNIAQLEQKSGCSHVEAAAALSLLERRGVLDSNGVFLGEHALFLGGMTNYQIRFVLEGETYLLRVPGEGTRKLINRRQEHEAYAAVSKLGITDDILLFDPATGFKISRFLMGTRSCNPYDVHDVKQCMAVLRRLHNENLSVRAEFDVFQKLSLYERLCRSVSLPYEDWEQTRKNVASLEVPLKKLPRRHTLCHIDPNHDNFLFYDGGLRLVDWEYAAMCDPDIDIAMFCIYAGYDLSHIDVAADLYYGGNCLPENRAKITCYAALCGLLWTYWCEFKKKRGITYGDYERVQYDYARLIAPVALERLTALSP